MNRCFKNLILDFIVLILVIQFQLIRSRALTNNNEEYDKVNITERIKGTEDENENNNSESSVWINQSESNPCALVILTSRETKQAPRDHLIRITHPILDVSNGVTPGVTYDLSLEILPDSEFLLEYWLNTSGTDESRLHVYSNPNNKKLRHQRVRRENQWIELSNSSRQVTFCSRNGIGGFHNETSANLFYSFTWLIKSNPIPSSSNVVFRLRFRSIGLQSESVESRDVFEQILNLKVKTGCHHSVKVRDGVTSKLTLSSLWNPFSENVGLNCTILLSPPPGFGLEARFGKLSIYGIRGLCKGRFLLFSSQSQNNFLKLQSNQVYEPELPTPFSYKYCGKLEDYLPEEKFLTFPSSVFVDGILLTIQLPGYIKTKEIFLLDISPLSPCEKVLLSNLTGELTYERTHLSLSNTSYPCSIVIHVPYGNTIFTQLQINTSEHNFNNESGLNSVSYQPSDDKRTTESEFECILNSRKNNEGNSNEYFIFRVEEFESSDTNDELETRKHNYIFCLTQQNSESLKRQWSSTGNKIRLTFSLNPIFLGFKLSYKSEPIDEIRRDCDEGWVHIENQGCVNLIEKQKTWMNAEEECQGMGGHLVTIKNDAAQRKLQHIIINSASFHKSRAYWIGANDRESEGNFQWTSGLPLIFTNWFPGWSFGKDETVVINAQPNDDGLSGQDCVEIRQLFAPSSMSHGSVPSNRNSHESSNFERSGHKIRSQTGKNAFHWNDRNCETLNFFICEKTKNQALDVICNRTIRLVPESSQLSSAIVTSPSYPSAYPDNILCLTSVETVSGYRIVITFDEFHLEDSPSCKYDALEILEEYRNETKKIDQTPQNNSRSCGDWTRRLKLLRYISNTNHITLKFESDFSHHFPGYKAKVSTRKVVPPRRTYSEDVIQQCQDEGMQGYGAHCYLAVSNPALSWENAQKACASVKGNLVSIVSLDEWRFLISILVSSNDYTKKSVYWLGAYIDQSNQLIWKDRMPFNFSAFHPSDLQSISEWKCLSLYWHEGGKGTFAWRLSNCNQASGYICKKSTKVDFRSAPNKTFTGIGGRLLSPNFPQSYYDDMYYTTGLLSPPGTLIVIQFIHLDIEPQDDCLYDYVQITDRRSGNHTRFCGSHYGKDLERYDFVSTSNGVDVIFHSDFSKVLTGFELIWRAVDVSECSSGKTILTGLGLTNSEEGTLHSPNFPYFNLPSLNCVYTIVAPAGSRIWINFEIFEVGIDTTRYGNNESDNVGSYPENCDNRDHVMLSLENESESHIVHESPNSQKSVILCGNLTYSHHRTSFVSYGEKIRIKLVTTGGRGGRGFLAKFKSMPSSMIVESFLVQTSPNSSFMLKSINYPLQPPPNLNVTMALTAPPNFIILLHTQGIANCLHLTSNSYIVVHDPYVGSNGTSWTVCQPETTLQFHEVSEESEMNNQPKIKDSLVNARGIQVQASAPISFHSTFNRLEVTQVYKGDGIRRKWNAEVLTNLDENFRAKVLSGGDRLLLLNACTPNPCLNGGTCVSDGDKHICRCLLPYTGPFCGLSVCDLSPCLFGECIVEDTSYRCICHMGYAGDQCDRRSKPCMRDGKDDKCTGHGECIEVNNSTYKCLCHVFWEGPRCESRVQKIQFRPLSERMLREPFWLGIITVTVVLGVIGLVWCMKRHFPEKLEKFLYEDQDRNRGISWVSARSPSSFRLGGGCSYHGVRDAIPGTSQQATSPQTSRSFLGRFGIRKPSLLSLSSATSVSAAALSPHTYENRTFSLDDLLRPSRSSMMRTPSPHRRRNFSIHSRRDPMEKQEKQQILQQLISSGASVSLDGSESKPPTPKPTIAEIIQMSEKRLRLASLASSSSMQNESSPTFSIFLDKAVVETETSFTTPVLTPTSASAASKAEKKVTFARLLEKLTAHEMSSSSSCSDLSCAEDKEKTIIINPKPPKKDKKGRLRRSKAYSRSRNSETDQDGVEMSSSDTTPDPIYTPRFPSRVCISPTGLSVSANNSPSLKSTGKSLPKMASADSLLALFRRFSGSSSAPPSPQYSENEESSAGNQGPTPLSTPSSPRNSALSLNIRPPAFLITTPDPTTDGTSSPAHDSYNTSAAPGSWRAQAQNMNVISLDVPMRDYCLSPIHEVPTPLPTPSHSPAHTPLMHRPKHPDTSPHAQGLPMIKLQPSSEAEDEEPTDNRRKSLPLVIPKIAISVENEEGAVMFTNSAFDEIDMARQIPDVLIHGFSESLQENNRFTFDPEEMIHIGGRSSPSPSPGRIKRKPPPLIFANEIMSDSKTRPSQQEVGQEHKVINVPIVNVENPTPVVTPSQETFGLDSKCVGVPPPDITAFAVMVSPKPWESGFGMHTHHHPLAPMILINQNSEAESDSDTPIRKLLRKPNLSFLSPFVGASDRVPSESNLSTSGYSSMASPCPSRCPSVSPLCGDSEEYHGGCGHHGISRRSSLVTPGSSRKSSLTMTPRRCSLNATSPLVSFASNLLGMGCSAGTGYMRFNEKSDLLEMEAETDSAMEAGADTETDAEKPDPTNNELDLVLDLLEVPRKNMPKSHSLDMDKIIDNPNIQRTHKSNSEHIKKGDSLDSKLNSVSGDPTALLDAFRSAFLLQQAVEEKRRLSPVSSRSGSMSELSIGGCGKIGGFTSPMSDSDGVYDCASSEVQSGTGNPKQIKKVYANSSHLSPAQLTRRRGRRRNRKRGSSLKKNPVSVNISPTGPGLPEFQLDNSPLDGSPKETKPRIQNLGLVLNKRTSASPKRRVRAQANLDVSSSSSESLHSQRSKESRDSSGTKASKKHENTLVDPPSFEEVSFDTVLPGSSTEKEKLCEELLDVDAALRDQELPSGSKIKSKKNSRSRLRAISLQIRFLKKLEKSLIRKKATLNSEKNELTESDELSISTTCSTCSSSLCSTSCSFNSSGEEGSREGQSQSSYDDRKSPMELGTTRRKNVSPPPVSSSLQSLSIPPSIRKKIKRKKS